MVGAIVFCHNVSPEKTPLIPVESEMTLMGVMRSMSYDHSVISCPILSWKPRPRHILAPEMACWPPGRPTALSVHFDALPRPPRSAYPSGHSCLLLASNSDKTEMIRAHQWSAHLSQFVFQSMDPCLVGCIRERQQLRAGITAPHGIKPEA